MLAKIRLCSINFDITILKEKKIEGSHIFTHLQIDVMTFYARMQSHIEK